MCKKYEQAQQRPEQRETASQIAAKKWIEEKRRIDVMYDRKVKPVKVKKGILEKRLEEQIEEKNRKKNEFEERTEQFFDAVDELFDELLARTFTVLEALNVVTHFHNSLTDGYTKNEAIRRLIKDVMRDIQNRIKDEYPYEKELK